MKSEYILSKIKTNLMKREFFVRVLLCTFLVAILVFHTNAYANQEKLEAGKWIEVNIKDSLKEHLSQLPQDEQYEQMRDWVVLAFMTHLELDEDKTFDALFDFTPMRHDFLQSLASYEYGESRYINLKSGELFVFVPYQSPKANVYIGRICDEYRLIYGKKPEKASIIEYQLSIGDDPKAQFVFAKDIGNNALFSEEMGYKEAKVLTKADLISFLKEIDDIVYVNNSKSEYVILGGRRFENYITRSVNLEDLAALYQADSNLKDEFRRKLQERGFKEEYEEDIQATVDRHLQEKPWDIISFSRKQIETAYRDNFPYKEYMKGLTEEYLKSIELNIGFSLDPQLNYKNFAGELKRILSGNPEFFEKWFNKNLKEKMKELFQLEQKKEKEQDLLYKKLFFNLFGEIGEISLATLINGNQAVQNDKKTSDNSIQSVDLSDDKIEEDVSEYFSAMISVINKNKDMLKYVSDKAMRNDLMPYYKLRRYLDGKIVIDLRLKQTQLSELEKLILRDVIEMLYNSEFLKNKEMQVYDKEVEHAVKQFQRENDLTPDGIVNNETYNLLKDEYVNSYKIRELNALDRFLEELKKSNSYQKGRYDGYLQGTEVGMTLFYTDLMMKLWGFDYKNSSPEDVGLGFIAKTNYPMDYSYYEDIKENPATRGWLGSLDSSYNFYNQSQLFFSHTATRIYNASSNDLFPGKEEVSANAVSARFSNWWNNHYTEVADYEQEYHRLNQIMKWSVITLWLKEEGKFPFLDYEKVERNLDFEKWYRSNMQLKTRVSLLFLNKKELGEKTECIGILESEPFIGFDNVHTGEFDIFRLSGGVSLAQKSQILKRLKIEKKSLGSLWKKKGINFELPHKPGRFTLLDGKSIKMNIPKMKLTIQKKIAKFRSKAGEFFRLKIDRHIQCPKNRIKIIDRSGNKEIGEVLCKKEGNRILLSNKEQDILKLKRVLEKAKEGKWDTERMLLSGDNVQVALKTNRNEYLIKLKNSDNYFHIKSATRGNPRMDIAVAAGKKSYLNANVIDKASFNSKISNYRWYKTNSNTKGEIVTELTNTAPKNTKTIYLSKEGIITEARVSGNSILIENNPQKLADNMKLLESLGGGSKKGAIDFVCKRLPNENNALLAIYDKNGKVLLFSNRKNISEANGKLFESLLPNDKGPIKGIAFSEKPNVRFFSDDVVQLPSKVNSQTKDIFGFINKKTTESKSWRNVFKHTDDIKIEDIRVLDKLNLKNYQLGESYFKFKSVKTLPDGYSLVDYRTIGTKPQLLIKTGKGNPRVIEINKSFGKDIAEIGKELKANYLENSILSEKDVLDKTKPVADLLKDAIKNSESNVLIVLGPDGIDPAIFAKLHKFPAHVRIFKDQPDVKRSVDNARIEIAAEFEGAEFFSTVPLQHKDYIEISSIIDGVVQTGVTINSKLSTSDFEHILSDKSKQQIVLIIRATPDGIVFSNRTVSYDTLNYLLNKSSTNKEMIYVVSNESEKLQKIFADSGKFNYVIASTYKIGHPSSFKAALENVRDFYLGFLSETSILKHKKFEKLMKNHPGLKKVFAGFFEKKGKKVIIPIGRLKRSQKKSIPQEVWNILGKYVPGNKRKPYRPKKLKNIINEMQFKLIRGLEKRIPKNLMDILKAIPNLKVENNIQRKNVAYA